MQIKEKAVVVEGLHTLPQTSQLPPVSPPAPFPPSSLTWGCGSCCARPGGSSRAQQKKRSDLLNMNPCAWRTTSKALNLATMPCRGGRRQGGRHALARCNPLGGRVGGWRAVNGDVDVRPPKATYSRRPAVRPKPLNLNPHGHIPRRPSQRSGRNPHPCFIPPPKTGKPSCVHRVGGFRV